MCLRFLSFFFTFIFFIQSSAWAFSGPADTKYLSAALEKFNSLSQKAKMETIVEITKLHPAYEKFFATRMEELGNQSIPKFTLEGDKVHFTYQEKSYSIEIENKSTISMMGVKFELTPDRFESSYNEFVSGIEAKLNSKKTTFLDLVIPSAQAETAEIVASAAGVLGLAVAVFGAFFIGAEAAVVGAIIMLLSGLGFVGFDQFRKYSMRKLCSEINNKLSEPGVLSSEKQEEFLRKIRATKRTLELKFCEGSVAETCQSSRKCLNSIETELMTANKSINGSSRSEIKEVPRSPTAPKSQGSKASQQ